VWKLFIGLFGCAVLAVFVEHVLILPAASQDRRIAAAIYMTTALVLWIVAGLFAMRDL
jgi:hypothetical protein